MTNALATNFANQKLPSRIKESTRFNAPTVDMGGMPYIRLTPKNSKFTFVAPDGNKKSGKVGAPVNIVILARADKVNRVYFEGEFVEGEPSGPPNCGSIDGVVPHPSFQNPPAKSCETCPMNAKGSGNDGESKACGFNLPVVGVPIDGKGNLHVKTPFVYRINANSLFGKSIPEEARYSFRDLQPQLRDIDPSAALSMFVTELSFDEQNDGLLKVLFQPKSYITDEHIDALEASTIDPEAMLAAMVPMGGAAPAEAPADKPADPSPAEMETVDEGNFGDFEEEVEEAEAEVVAPKAVAKKKVAKKKAASKKKAAAKAKPAPEEQEELELEEEELPADDSDVEAEMDAVTTGTEDEAEAVEESAEEEWGDDWD